MLSRFRRATRDVTDVAQFKEWLAAFARGEVRDVRAGARARLPRLPLAPGRGTVWAVSTVRDERDVIASSIAHLLDQGVDGVIVLDHRSTDGTREILRELAARDPRVHLAVDDQPGHFQAPKITRLARAAWWAGAEWVIPFDADEFWFAEHGTLAETLRASDAAVLTAQMHDAVPTGDGPSEFREQSFRLDPKPSGDVKVAFRAHPLVRVGSGNHGVSRVGRQDSLLHIVHAPYRGTIQLARKFANGADALEKSSAASWEGWHWRAGAGLDGAELQGTWDRIRAGDPVELIGWRPSGQWHDGPVLRATAWAELG